MQYPCSISRKKRCDEVDFLHADLYQGFLEFDTIFFDGFGQAYPKYTDRFALSLQYLKDEVRNEIHIFACR